MGQDKTKKRKEKASKLVMKEVCVSIVQVANTDDTIILAEIYHLGWKRLFVQWPQQTTGHCNWRIFDIEEDKVILSALLARLRFIQFENVVLELPRKSYCVPYKPDTLLNA